jgi:transcriptional regulator with XRE-family HTH domain
MDAWGVPLSSKPPSTSRRLFAERLRAERKARGLSLEDLGDLSGLSWNYIGQVERSQRNISVDHMDALARALGIQLYQLLMADVIAAVE